MSVYHSLGKVKRFKNAVVALGTFDGVHRGHQLLINTAVQKAAELNGTCLVLTFDHIPREVLKHNVFGVLLTPLAEKIRLIHKLGARHILVMKFNRSLAALPPQKFVAETLVKKLGVKLLVVGENYRFGAGRAGGIEQLTAWGKTLGFRVLVVPSVRINGARVSSTGIRELLKAGKIDQANRWLGWKFNFTGNVVKGRHFGTRIGFPTANLVLDRRILLPEGVFAARVIMAGKRYGAVVNVGFRPSLRKTGKPRRIAEAFIFRFHRMIYHRQITIEMVKKIRAERVFGDARELAGRIATDVGLARKILGNS
jgi:riboflavin kinase/FMN adenylyltransferase